MICSTRKTGTTTNTIPLKHETRPPKTWPDMRRMEDHTYIYMPHIDVPPSSFGFFPMPRKIIKFIYEPITSFFLSLTNTHTHTYRHWYNYCTCTYINRLSCVRQARDTCPCLIYRPRPRVRPLPPFRIRGTRHRASGQARRSHAGIHTHTHTKFPEQSFPLFLCWHGMKSNYSAHNLG